jgi:hypothetical protein
MSNQVQANQHTPDTREDTCWELYVQSITNGSPNALKSALEAGYSEDHARNITLQGWFKDRKDKLVRIDMLSKAESILHGTLSMDIMDQDNKPIPVLLKIQTDIAKYIASTLGKKVGYSTDWREEDKQGNLIIEVTDYDGYKPAPITYVKPWESEGNPYRHLPEPEVLKQGLV